MFRGVACVAGQYHIFWVRDTTNQLPYGRFPFHQMAPMQI